MELEQIKEDYAESVKGKRIAISINPIAIWKTIKWWKNKRKKERKEKI